MKSRPLDSFAAVLTLALCILWGFNQVIVKAALPEIGPIWQTGARSAVGCVCVAAYALATGWQMNTAMPDALDLSKALILGVDKRGAINVVALNVSLPTR